MTQTTAENGSPTSEELISATENGTNGKENAQKKVQLQRKLGLMDGVGIIVGVIVGSGIFLTPKGVLAFAGSPGLAIIIWILSGILGTIGALCYAELGTMIPKSGGDYAYLNEAFGSLWAFLYMWSAFVIIMPTGIAVTAITFAQYLMQPLWVGCNPPFAAVRLVAGLVILFLTMLNCYNVKWVAKVTDTFSICKVLALIVIIVFGVVTLVRGNYSDSVRNPMEGSESSAAMLSLSFYAGLFSFAGWNYLNFVTEEIVNPYKNLPRAIVISLPLVTVIYVLVNCAYFVVLDKQEVLASDAVAVTFGNKTLGYFTWIIPLFVVCATFGSLNSTFFTSSRLFFVGAQYGHLPKAISLININSFTPIPSLIALGFLSAVLVVVENVYSLINYTTFVESLFTLFSVGGLLWLRYKQPEAKRPIKVNIVFPVLFFVIFALLCFVPFIDPSNPPLDVAIGFLIILSGIPMYVLFVMKRDRFPWVRNVSSSFNHLCAKLFLSVPEEGKYQ